jgi:predicted anti-sigma-YlaC factor YlaD
MKKNLISCKDVMQHVCESLGEELNSSKCKAIKKHLENCKDCQNYFRSVELTIDFYRKYNIEISEEAHQRLIHYLKLDVKS